MEYFRQRFNDDLNSNGPVDVAGFTWESAEVFKTMAEHDYEATFTVYVQDQIQQAKERVAEFLDENGCLDRFRTLTARKQNGQILPFIGAGMSIASGYRPWGAFLLSLLPDAPQIKADVEAMLTRGDYEEAAQLVHDTLGPGVLAEEINNQLGRHRPNAAGPVCLLPSLFQNEVLTTNFDYVLTHIYIGAANPFSNEFCGQRLREARQRLGNEPHCLLRLHGEADAQDGRVLTQAEYDAAYNGGVTLTGILGALIGTRSLLFMGSSLQSDRTYSALCDIRAQNADAPVRHYAFLPCPVENDRAARRAFLAEAEIHPIYYPADDHDQHTEDLLITLMEGGLDE
ncbi:SIR2 family protein [Notoacmeibacter sp. MSK16QG-6]|uniref:SIR2 family NAD-dependent protein deacylase n=1 Tax=Notoacmeibacter sp. MSK16QG-6 TaxID=2957982 RepID=UPI00209F23BA|nr:SIR2 family protein [Notoacmeibacter sp. MSK16QG-6]MCP1199079.1 SIR2 family protein [Notoacmeibacter sp. MSK16QG-6]